MHHSSPHGTRFLLIGCRWSSPLDSIRRRNPTISTFVSLLCCISRIMDQQSPHLTCKLRLHAFRAPRNILCKCQTKQILFVRSVRTAYCDGSNPINVNRQYDDQLRFWSQNRSKSRLNRSDFSDTVIYEIYFLDDPHHPSSCFNLRQNRKLGKNHYF